MEIYNIFTPPELFGRNINNILNFAQAIDDIYNGKLFAKEVAATNIDVFVLTLVHLIICGEESTNLKLEKLNTIWVTVYGLPNATKIGRYLSESQVEFKLGWAACQWQRGRHIGNSNGSAL